MTLFLDTPFGRFRKVNRPYVPALNGNAVVQDKLLACPGCGEWLTITHRQLRGQEAIYHAPEMGGCEFCYMPNFVAHGVREVQR